MLCPMVHGLKATSLTLRICSRMSTLFIKSRLLYDSSVIHGTVIDTSLLIDHIGSYILTSPDDPTINQHFVLGVSLGGHAAWQCLFGEPRITAAVVIIGCPDYMRKLSRH
jgi:hypothetical protein